VKQIELADLPGGSEETKLNEEPGAEYLYDLYKNPRNEDIDVKTYAQIFPYEWPKIEARPRALSSRTKKEAEEARLPAAYEDYARLLEKVADLYGSPNVDPKVLDKSWDELYALAKKVTDGACPLILIPQGAVAVAGAAEKVDVEIRLELKTVKNQRQEEELNKYTHLGQEILAGQASTLAKPYTIPRVNLTYQPWAFGPNLYWQTRGESNASQILLHTNAVSEAALAKEWPLLKKAFKGEKIEETAYQEAALAETVLHEVGHNVIPYNDKAVRKRLGPGFAVEILEELKAETIGMKILGAAIKKGFSPAGLEARSQLLAKLGANLDYLKNKSSKKASSGEPYYPCAAAIIGRLLERGLLVKGENGYELGATGACALTKSPP